MIYPCMPKFKHNWTFHCIYAYLIWSVPLLPYRDYFFNFYFAIRFAKSENIMVLFLLGYQSDFHMYYNKVKHTTGYNNDSPFHPFHLIPYPPTGWTNWPINGMGNSNLNWHKNFSCHNIHVYSTSITISLCLYGF